MEQIKQLTYQGTEKKAGLNLRFDYFFILALSFLLGQARVVPGIYPFFLVYGSIFAGYNIFLVSLVLASGFTGLAFTDGPAKFAYLAGMGGILLYNLYSKRFEENKYLLPLIVTIPFLITIIILNNYLNVLLYRHFLRIGEAIFIFAFILITRQGSKNLFWKKKRLTNIEKLTILFIFVGGLVGFSSVSYHSIIIDTLVLLLLLGTSTVLGIYRGVFLAGILGLILHSSGIIPMIIIIKYIIFAFMMGIIRNKSKVWIPFSLILGFLLYSGFSPEIYNLKVTCLEMVIAGTLFLAIPDRAWEFIFNKFKENRDNKLNQIQGDDQIYQKMFRDQFNELSAVFSELSTAFREVLPAIEQEERQRVEDFIYLFKNKNCKKCPQKRLCWQQKRDRSYKILEKLLLAARRKGEMNKDLIDKYLKKMCTYRDTIISGVKNSYEIFQVNNFWKNKLIDRQEIVSEQLAGISNIIKGFAADPGLNLSYNLSKENIHRKLRNYRIDIKDIKIETSFKTDKVNIKIKMEPCSGNSPCKSQLIKILNSEFPYNFRLLNSRCGSKLKEIPCQLHYGPVGNYHLYPGIAQKGYQGKISGDSYLYKMLPDGQDIIVLSDGMGSGRSADRESKTAIDLFSNIIEAGFKQNTAIKTINSALYLRNQDEKFTTLDISFFDTFSSQLELKKIGAVSTYIKRGWDIIEIKSSTVPVGILEETEVNSHTEKLQDEDFIFMISDGVLEANKNAYNKEEWFKQLLMKTSFNDPQVFADYIMELLRTDYNINDDVTILVFKVEKEIC